ncbi:hypothetical protein AB434_3257 [Heyndrickxia coagulans]|jgi:hypothetical protein|uniref:Uncharacterized protein n=1 Tax=Heyndrickxia coagulans TaxID=1398 RepID=A0A0C5C3E8_HEYCO|nr:hypothetical protein SB48_HM08orf03218 [Heyndrickxia coagulans]AKN55662.1 hypothetical protein AB434_3257 [Heyndrickxia coagulans]KWZ84326.1 hypothetical protein HMPREF3213_00848 [Heyndrickxia coagulans]KYC61186.1 hypothetical protein B4100_3286 [Heyndrickxia coagulans]KYC87270.1 hypothetical protein B4096_3182 [Heyndrickxia coagulans]
MKAKSKEMFPCFLFCLFLAKKTGQAGSLSPAGAKGAERLFFLLHILCLFCYDII